MPVYYSASILPKLCKYSSLVSDLILQHACMLNHFSNVQLFVIPWTAAPQALLSIVFSRPACVLSHFSNVQPTLCDPMDCSPPGSSVHSILQARILECFAIPSSRGSSQPRDHTCLSYVSCTGRQLLYH